LAACSIADRTLIRQNVRIDTEPEIPARGPAAVADALTRSGAFVECVFSCPSCGLAGTSLIRPGRLAAKECLGCGDPVVVTVLERFPRR
jgi:hypothetical protein